MAIFRNLRPELKPSYFTLQLCARIVLYVVFLRTERLEPVIREIPADQAWRHSHPVTKSYVSSTALWTLVYTVPPATILPWFARTGDWLDLRQAALAYSLGLLVTGLATNCLKSAVGRPRPDFLSRCHGDGRPRPGAPCSGDPRLVAEGRLSFPSGHSSLCGCMASFSALYWAGKLAEEPTATRRRWRPLLVAPPAAAALVATSRVLDFHHHWEDVVVGLGIGVAVAAAVYHWYYPSVFVTNAGRPLATGEER